jgi:hypothetical protein
VGRLARGSGQRPEPGLPHGSKLLIASSVPVYFVLAWLIATRLPDYAFFALVPAAFGIHSAALLVGQRLRRD